ncbi:group 1 truncated hemoglobin [Bacteriovorax sp. Seq25_V]|uniref:group I truncated hemoglobin n=1 Tax=Bacteriovorax sp. Seq25_V TaxID=1201288 RepID=UPI00054DA76A|nr:group 1 truncated hemoglobin [Bacteriovorax sp. Seq25_V]
MNSGYNRVYSVIVNLYEELCDHPEIAVHFIGIDIDRLIKLQTQFVSRALGYDVEYTGRPLYRAHHPLKITDFQYEEVDKIFARLFLKHGFSEDDAKKIKECLIQVRPAIVSSKWSLIDQIVKPFYSVINYFENILRKRKAID